MVENSTRTMQFESIYNNWQTLKWKDWMNLKLIVDKVYWLKTKFIGSPIFNGEQVIRVTGRVRDDRFAFDYVDAYIPDGKGGFQCFDGEPSDIFNLKLDTLDTFNTGIQHYFKQAFSQAIKNFEEVLHHNPADKTAQLFLQKARQLEEMGVAENWTGVELMMQK